jgi:hypothetical protein
MYPSNYFLYQKIYDGITKAFIEGKMDKFVYLKFCDFFESKREMFTINLN